MNRLLAEKIINLARLDEEVRSSLLQRGELFGGYHAEMELVHNTNADSFAMILDEYGWPRREDIGDEAARASWMVVQHAILVNPYFKSAVSSY